MTIYMRTSLVAWSVTAMMLAAPSHAEAQDSLAAARDLYASASYADALTMLNSLAATERPRDERQLVELYRTLCLVALGRKAEADQALERMIAQDPLYRPPMDDLPPRMRNAFRETRKRLLPSIIQNKYADAKTAFDRKNYALAESGFKQVLAGLADPDIAPAAAQPPLADLRILAEGFHDLSAKANVPPPAPPAPVAAAPDSSRIYGVADRNVVPPVTVKQRIPPLGAKMVTSAGHGAVEVVIGITGAVESARMIVPLNGPLDQIVLSEARMWQYHPATLNGVPVRYRKQVKVTLQPPPPTR